MLNVEDQRAWFAAHLSGVGFELDGVGWGVASPKGAQTNGALFKLKAVARKTASRYLQLKPLLNLLDRLEGNTEQIGYRYK